MSKKPYAFPMFICPNIALIYWSKCWQVEFSELGRRGENAWHRTSKPEKRHLKTHSGEKSDTVPLFCIAITKESFSNLEMVHF